MRVFLTGSTGQLGSDLLRLSDESTLGLDFNPLDRSVLDLEQLHQIEEILAEPEFDVLINCAAYNKVDDAEEDATRAFVINAHAVKRMAHLCREKGARFVHVSTDYVFGGDATRTIPYQEKDCRFPINVYGASKGMGEAVALQSHPDTLILRVASLFGVAGVSRKDGNFVETMIRMGREQGLLRVLDDQIMSPTSTADVARALYRLLEHRAEPGLYHVVNSGQASWFEFAREIISRAGVEAEVEPVQSEEISTLAARPAYSVLDNSKVEHAIQAQMPRWADALARYLEERQQLV